MFGQFAILKQVFPSKFELLQRKHTTIIYKYNSASTFNYKIADIYSTIEVSSELSPHPSPPSHLLLSGDLSCDQKPEEALRQRLRASWSFRQQLLALWNAETPETDSLGIKGWRGGSVK